MPQVAVSSLTLSNDFAMNSKPIIFYPFKITFLNVQLHVCQSIHIMTLWDQKKKKKSAFALFAYKSETQRWRWY